MSDSKPESDVEWSGHVSTKAPPLFRKVMYKLGIRHPGFEFEDDPDHSDDE